MVAEMDVEEQLQKLLRFCHFDPKRPLIQPPEKPRSLAKDVHDASLFRKYMDDHMKIGICGCCSRRRDLTLMLPEAVGISSLANLHLLTTTPQPTDKEMFLARDGLTKSSVGGEDYCLQPSAIQYHEDGLDTMTMCQECYESLEHKCMVPPASLVRVDTGSIPSHLKPLSMFEEKLLGLNVAHRYVYVMKASGKDSTLKQWKFRGHVIAFPNVDASSVRKIFPIPMDEIPEHVQVGIYMQAFLPPATLLLLSPLFLFTL